MEYFAIGDIVKHGEIGVSMTVKSQNEGKVVCNWFENGDLKEEEFLSKELILVSR